jgi:hypothetical protein
VSWSAGLAGDHALPEQEAAIGAGIADLHHGEGLLGRLVEGEALNAGERLGAAERMVEFGLDLAGCGSKSSIGSTERMARAARAMVRPGRRTSRPLVVARAIFSAG